MDSLDNKNKTMLYNEEEIEVDKTLALDKHDDSYGVYPIESIRIEKGRMSLYELKRRKERGDVKIDPDFQREFVWDKKQKGELIESVLMGIPIPVFYFFENKEGEIQVVDGRQRISTFIDFIDDKFELTQLKIIKNIIGKKFSSLDSLQQRKIEDYQIDTYTIQPPTPEQVKFDIFDRVNRGGTRLNRQEMRNALYQGKSTELINELSKEECFKKATANSIKSNRMKDRYIILRFIGFYIYFSKVIGNNNIEYKGNIDEFLFEIMLFLNDIKDNELISNLKSMFKKVMGFAYGNYGEDIFRFDTKETKKRPLNMALFESLSYLFALCIDNHKKPTKQDVDNLKQYFDKSKQFTNSIDSVTSVKHRFSEVDKFLKDKL